MSGVPPPPVPEQSLPAYPPNVAAPPYSQPARYAAPPGYGAPQIRASRLDPAGNRPTLVVAAFIALLFFGSQFANAVIPDGVTGRRPAGGAAEIGNIRVLLADGWRITDVEGGTRLAKGSVAIDVLNIDFAGDPSALYEEIVAQALAPNAMGFEATDPSLVIIGAGIPAAQGAYAGIFAHAGEVEGQLTAFVVDGDGYVFDAWSHAGGLSRLVPEVELMIDSVQVIP